MNHPFTAIAQIAVLDDFGQVPPAAAAFVVGCTGDFEMLALMNGGTNEQFCKVGVTMRIIDPNFSRQTRPNRLVAT